MPNKNPYFIENKVPIVEIREIDYQVPSWEEFIKTYQEDERVTRLYESIYQAEVLRGPQYGPGNSQSQLGVNIGVFGVVGKETHSGRTRGNNQVVNYIRFHLNRQLTYANGRFDHIDFIDRLPFNTVQVGDTLKIDLDQVSNSNSDYKFSACNVAERGSVNLRNMTEKEELGAKSAVGAVVFGANMICPGLGDVFSDFGEIAGFGASVYGNLVDDKEMARGGEILYSGSGLGSSASRVCDEVFLGGRQEHRNNCFADGICQNEDFKDFSEAARDTSNVVNIVNEATKFLKP
jgi:hypothetical protein